jgi:hypothetical protein
MEQAVNTIIVYGPPGCGKTYHADVLLAHFGLSRLVDEWGPCYPLQAGALHLTEQPRETMLHLEAQGARLVEYTPALVEQAKRGRHGTAAG